MVKQFGNRLKLLYIDTDGLFYHIQSDCLNNELKNIQYLFDFSNLPPDHPLYNTTHKSVPGKFKNETANNEISSCVFLRSKQYSYVFANNVVKKAKGIQKSVVDSNLSHQQYVDCLHTSAKSCIKTYETRSYDHQLFTNSVTKAGLSPFDDKRYILDNGVETLAFGHHKITQINDMT